LSSTTYATPVDDLMVIGGIASMLARRGAPALPAALQALDRYVGGACTLRPPEGNPDLPQPRIADSDCVDFPLYQGNRLLGWLRACGMAPPYRIEVVAAVADVVALSLTAPHPDLFEELLVDIDVDRDVLADELHDGVAQALVAARYATDLAGRGLRTGPLGTASAPVAGAELERARAAVQEALIGVRQVIWWQRSRGGADLLGTLLALADRQRAAGAPELRIAVLPPGGDATRGLRPAVAVTAYRLVQEALRYPGGAVTLLVRRTEAVVELELRGNRIVEAVAGSRWSRQVAVLGGRLTVAAGRLQVSLPVDRGVGR
jgi:signal transduction histidine kinase